MKTIFYLILPALMLAFTSCSGSSDKFIGQWRVVGGDVQGLCEPVVIEKQGNFYTIRRPFMDGHQDMPGYTYDKARDLLVGKFDNDDCELRYNKSTDQLDLYRLTTRQHLFLLEHASKPDHIAALVFGNVKTSIADSDKARILSQMDIRVAPDGKQFVSYTDIKNEYPFLIKAYPLDLNGDGKDEIYLMYHNEYGFPTQGYSDGRIERVDNGNSSALFTRSPEGRFQIFNLAPGFLLYLPTKTNGYYDLIMVRKGEEDHMALFKSVPNHRYNNEYMTQEAIRAANPKPLEQLSPAYQGTK